jgi:hypothetical protein
MNLSSEGRQSLESMAQKYTSPYCDVMKAYPTMSLLPDWIRPARSSASGASDSLSLDCRALRRCLEAGVKPAFPPPRPSN